MVHERKGLRSLWDTPEKEERAHKIIGLLKAGDVQGAQRLLETQEGRWDVKGFDFAMRSDERPFQYFTPFGVSTPIHEACDDRNVYKNLVLNDYNFSLSLLSNSSWVDCTFRNCVFNRSDLLYSSFRGCTFEHVKFLECWIENAGLGLSTEKNLGLFSDVEIAKGIISRAVFGFPRIKRCTFACDIRHTDFHGSQFLDSKFSGALKRVYFHCEGIPMRGSPEEHLFVERPLPHNPMKNVDFSKARFEDVKFIGCIDLTDCHLPEKGGVFLVQNSPRVFEEAMRRMEMDWKLPDKEKALNLARSFSKTNQECPKPQLLINSTTLKRNVGEEFGEHFLGFVRAAMKSKNS